MNPAIRCLLLILVVCTTACDRAPKRPVAPLPKPQPTPSLGPPAQRSTSAERLRADEAMTFDDLSLQLRTGTREEEVLQEVARRGFVNSIDRTAAQSLAALGASPRLIAVVQDPQYVLTAAELKEYAARMKHRAPAAQSQAQAEQKKRAAEFEERQRQLQRR